MNETSSQAEALLPAGLREKIDPASDPVLEALRKELVEILEHPFDARRLRLAGALLSHADQILQLRKGAPPRRGRRFGSFTNPVSNDEEDDPEDDPISPSTEKETMGTHAMREVVGMIGKALDVMSHRPESKVDVAGRAMAANSLVHALVEADKLQNDEVREAVVERLHNELRDVLGVDVRTIDAEDDEPARLNGHAKGAAAVPA